MEKTTVKITGMDCQHCAKAVQTTLEKIDGIEQVNVDLENATAEIGYQNKKNISLWKEAVDKAGYSLAE